MGRKLRAIEEYFSGMKSAKQICLEFCIRDQSFRSWIRKYKMDEKNGLVSSNINNVYSKSIKYESVLDYLSGNKSQKDICTKYNI